MKILQITTHLNIGGIGSYVTTLAKELRRKGHTVFVASSGGRFEETLRQSGIGHIFLDIRTKSEMSPKVIKSFLALRSFLKQEKIDLIHAHTRVTQVVSALLSLDQKIPCVTTCHGFFKNRLGRRIFSCWGKRVVAISAAVEKQLIRDFHVNKNRVALIPTGIAVEAFSQGISEREKAKIKSRWNLKRAPVIGTIGRLSSVKGQDILLRAAKALLKDFSDIKVLLVGDGPDENRLKQLSSTLGLDKNVIFIGSLEDTSKALSIMDVFVLPSINEGLGLSLIEAMASGKPCVASKVGGIENLIDDGVTGLLVKPGDPEGFASAIKYILSNKDKAETFKKKAREKVIKDFDIDKMVTSIEKIYATVSGLDTNQGKIPSQVPDPKKRILIFSVNWLGDIIFTSPFIRGIREVFPDSYIVCVAPPRCKEILEASARVNEFIIFDEAGQEKTFLGKARFALKLRKEKFDVAFLLHRSFTKALITFLAGINERIGYDTKGRGFILTNKLRSPAKAPHRVEYFLELAKAVGADTSNKDYEFFITESDKKKAGSILESAGVNRDDRIVVFNPGGNWDPKRWPADRFAELADRLIDKYGVTVLITGAEKDKALVEKISRGMRNKAIPLYGKTGIRELASIFKSAKLVVSGDTGPMHIAVSVGANVVSLFGPTSTDITGPYGRGNYAVIRKDIGCSVPCYDYSCSDNRCMKAISTDDVISVIEKKGYLK